MALATFFPAINSCSFLAALRDGCNIGVEQSFVHKRLQGGDSAWSRRLKRCRLTISGTQPTGHATVGGGCLIFVGFVKMVLRRC